MLQVLQTAHVRASVCVFESEELMFGAVKGLTHYGFILIDFVQGPFCVRKYPSQNVLCQCRLAFLRLVKHQNKIKIKLRGLTLFQDASLNCAMLCWEEKF